MITAENSPVSNSPKQFGFYSLYDFCEDPLIGEGVLLVGQVTPGNTSYPLVMFETSTEFNILYSADDLEIMALPGTIIMLKEDLETSEQISWEDPFTLDECRFPTIEELDLYNKFKLV